MMDGLIDILLKLGGPVLAHALGRRFGGEIGDLAQDALDALGKAFGVEPDADRVGDAIDRCQKEGPGIAEAKVKLAEADMARVYLAQAELQRAGNDQQKMTNELLQSEMASANPWAASWLWVWQWVLMAFWGWTVLVAPVGNAALRIFFTQSSTDLITGALVTSVPTIPAVDAGTLLTLTGIYLSLHMGGHTVLELMRNQWGGLFGAKDKDAG